MKIVSFLLMFFPTLIFAQGKLEVKQENNNSKNSTNPPKMIKVETVDGIKLIENPDYINNDNSFNFNNYTAKDRLRIDFEIKNDNNPSPELLEKLGLNKLEVYRKEDNSVEILDPNTGVIIILYSINDALKKETESKYFIDYIRTLYFNEY